MKTTFNYIFCIFLLSTFQQKLNAQTPELIINTYTKVTGIDTCKNSVHVENSSGFNEGKKALIIQMQGAEMDVSNSSSFGKVVKLNAAGNYEFVTIAKIDRGEITFKNKILRNYNPSGSVQLITVPEYDNLIINNTFNPTASAWNGNTGGVLVLEVKDSLSLKAYISVSGKGFRGGTLNTSQHTPCNLTDYFYSVSDNSGAGKGEGIVNFDLNYARGKGAISNGGGGGNSQNAGGGGGSNGGSGGLGGYDYNGPFCNYLNNLNTRGMGGYELPYDSLQNKIFMGGGGGAGHHNNENGTAGAPGGGIIIIKTKMLYKFLGSGGGFASVGYSALSAADDGSGGGGAGGTILLNFESLETPTLFSFTTFGGNGGNNEGTINNLYCFGPGGGGGGGVILTDNVPKHSSITNTGGTAGIMTNTKSNCYNTTYGATNGLDGIVKTGFIIPESTLPFIKVKCETPKTNNSIIKIPNIITPNGDGYNDYFIIEGINLNDALWNLSIYNRWGQEVYKSINYKNNWNADNLSDGIYFYLLQKNNEIFKGWVEVNR